MALELISITEPSSPAAEAYRRLRTNLFVSGAESALRTLLVTSPGADPEKSTVVANLAVAFARVGKRVVVVDCDLRHAYGSTQHTLFGLTNTQGLTDALQAPGGTPPLQATALPGLRVLTSGAAVDGASDLIASPAMADLIGVLSAEADIVLFDAPPVLLATEAPALASQVDGVLLTVSAGQTKRDEAQRARSLLSRVNARILGAVLVNAPAPSARLQQYLAN